MRRNTALQTASGKARARSTMQSVRLSHDERTELRALARAAKVSVSDYLRAIIRVHVERTRKGVKTATIRNVGRVAPRKVDLE